MPKRIVYTKITPLPANVPRQLALDMLHAHSEIIELNPLVTGHKPINAPRDAVRDEYFAQWYEIEEIITWGFGMKKRIAFKGCFHDMPWGLQTHIYAPMGVDLRNSYRIAGNQPGEPKEVRELGVDTPAEGLYLKEDVEITCNIALAGFVKKETKQTLLTMIERMTRKAELLDDGVLHAMFENGKLKTINPTQAQHKDLLMAPSMTDLASAYSPLTGSPSSIMQDFSPGHTFTKYSSLPGRIGTRRSSQVSSYQDTVHQKHVELDSSPVLHNDGFLRPLNAVEMEGSLPLVADNKDGYTYHGKVSHAELADTSSSFTPQRDSMVSSNYSDQPGSAIATSVNSRYSVESQHRPSAAQGADSSPPIPSKNPNRLSAMITGGSGSYTVANPDQPSRSTLPYPDGPDAYVRADYHNYTNSLCGSQGSADHMTMSNQMGGLNITGVHENGTYGP